MIFGVGCVDACIEGEGCIDSGNLRNPHGEEHPCVEHIPFFSFMRQNVDKENLAKGACVEKAQ